MAPEICIVLLLLLSCLSDAVEVTLLTTEGVTTDLGWGVYKTGEMSGFNGWEEQSFILFKNQTVRGYQVCQVQVDTKVKEKPESWLLLPGINASGASRIFIEMNFTMRECSDLEKTCRETFSVYYRIIDDANREKPFAEAFSPLKYTKIDTVAAEVRFSAHSSAASDSLVNRETVSISLDYPGAAKVLHVGIVDVGACMALMGVRVYHKVCPQVVTGLAVFNETRTGASDTSLVSVTGSCVPNAVFPEPSSASPEVISPSATFEPETNSLVGPLYHCTSSGEWQVQTGECQCMAGHQPAVAGTECEACPTGTYKPSMGNYSCRQCPDHSSTVTSGAQTCECDVGYYTTISTREEKPIIAFDQLLPFDENHQRCDLCSKLPSPPSVSIEENRIPGSIKLKWNRPIDDGGCNTVRYCIVCRRRPVSKAGSSAAFSESTECDHARFSLSRCHIISHEVAVNELRGHMSYEFTVVSYSLVTKQRYPRQFEMISNENKSSLEKNGDFRSKNEKLRELLNLSSSLMVHRTGDTLPSSVREVTLVFGNQTSIAFKWTKPEYPNGRIIYYEVKWTMVYEEESETEQPFGAPGTYISPPTDWNSMTINETNVILTKLYPGTMYLVVIFTHNSAGSDNGSAPLSATTSPQEEPTQGIPSGPNNRPFVIATVAIAVLVIVIICIIITLQWKCELFKTKKTKQNNQVSEPQKEFRPFNSHHETLDQRTYVDPFSLDAYPSHRFLCETSPESITCESVIGRGEFGEVYKGTLATIDLKTGQETTIQVAVKQLKDQCEAHEQVNFLREAMSLEKFRHPNIVHLEAVVTSSRPFFIVTELMDHGSLLAHLTRLKEKADSESDGQSWIPPLPPVTIAKMLRGVARGMEYLSGRGFVHRDLAARNVLINSDLVCKVADFGLTREVESDDTEDGSNGSGTYTTRGGKIAIRWTAPEAMAFRTYTQFSDVWSFGILMWEAASFGEKPYWDLTNHEVLKAVNDGFRLPAPEHCPSVFHQLMIECWHQDPENRPSFTSIISKFDLMISDERTLEIPASPASSGIAEIFFVDDERTPTADQDPCEMLDEEEEVAEPLLTTVMVDRHNCRFRPMNDEAEEYFELTNGDEDQGSEVSSCTSTICASEVTVCAVNGAVIYVPLSRSGSGEIRTDSPLPMGASPLIR